MLKMSDSDSYESSFCVLLFQNALTTLAKVSDALKTQFEDKFDNEDIEMKKTWYKEWGQNRQNDF